MINKYININHIYQYIKNSKNIELTAVLMFVLQNILFLHFKLRSMTFIVYSDV